MNEIDRRWEQLVADRARLESMLKGGDEDELLDAIHAVGRADLRAFTSLVDAHLSHNSPLVRTEALRTLARRFHLPGYDTIALERFRSEEDDLDRSEALGFWCSYHTGVEALQVLYSVASDAKESDEIRRTACMLMFTAGNVPFEDWLFKDVAFLRSPINVVLPRTIEVLERYHGNSWRTQTS